MDIEKESKASSEKVQLLIHIVTLTTSLLLVSYLCHLERTQILHIHGKVHEFPQIFHNYQNIIFFIPLLLFVRGLILISRSRFEALKFVKLICLLIALVWPLIALAVYQYARTEFILSCTF